MKAPAVSRRGLRVSQLLSLDQPYPFVPIARRVALNNREVLGS